MSHQVEKVHNKQHVYKYRGEWRIDWKKLGFSTTANPTDIRYIIARGKYWKNYCDYGVLS